MILIDGTLEVRSTVDRVYKKALPEFRRTLESLSERFASLDTRTNWDKLRIDPLLRHVTRLEHVIGSREFSQEFSRLKRGVRMFKSDLDYLRANVKILKGILEFETGVQRRRSKKVGRRSRS